MIIVVDIGNTNIKYGVFENNKLIAQFKQRTFNNATSDEIGLFICQFFFNNDFLKNDIDGVIISSVVPQIMFSFSHAIKKYFNIDPIIIGKNLQYDFSYISKEEISFAADRLVCCYYAFKRYKGPLIVVDFGTATTFDVLGENGSYLGGAIFPGVKILPDVLTEKTAQLPMVEIQYPETVCVTNTINQMQAGILYGYVGAVKNILNELVMQVLFGEKVKVIATGGLVSLINKREKIFDIVDKTLILDGLNSLYNEHKNGK